MSRNTHRGIFAAACCYTLLSTHSTETILMSSISRRDLLRAATGIAALAATPRIAFAQATGPAAGPFTLPPLVYQAAALEPHIDAKTMEIHHDRHHQAYVTNLNTFAKDNPQIAEKAISEVLGNLAAVPE